jgi:serine-type D-Ala-D-Ala carboxypeptidase
MHQLFTYWGLLLVSFSLSPVWGQSEGAVEPFKQAEQAVTVLRNAGDIVPLRGLGSLRIAYLGIGEPLPVDFLGTLRRYAPIAALDSPAPGEPLAEWLAAQRAAYNLFIVEIQDYSIDGELPSAFQHLPLIELLAQQPNTLFVLHGDGGILQASPALWEAAFLAIAPAQLPAAPAVAAQIIFGGLGAKAQLMGPIYETPFQRGAGLATPGGLRLSYLPLGYLDAAREQEMADSIRAIMAEGIRAGAFPGGQVLVAKDGQVIFHETFGYHTYENQRATDLEDIYDFASVTKISAALPAAMQLYGAGRFDLDAPLKRYLPRFGASNKGDIPFRPILAHQARLRPWIAFWRGTLRGQATYPWKREWELERNNDFRFKWRTFRADSSRAYSIYVADELWLHRKYPQKMYRSIRKSPLNEETGYVYSDLAFFLLPAALERLVGQPLELYLQQNVYGPLGAGTLGYNPLRRFPRERIVPTERDTFFRMALLHGRVHDEGAAMLGGISGHAGLFGTANDLAKLMTLYMNYGNYGGEQLIPEAAVREFTRCQYCAEGNRRALGFDRPLLEYQASRSMVAEAASPQSFGHSGYTGTFTWADPESGLLLVFFSNRVYPTRDNNRLAELNIRPRIHAAVYGVAAE